MKTNPYKYEQLSDELLEKMNPQRLEGLRKKMTIINSKLEKEDEEVQEEIDKLTDRQKKIREAIDTSSEYRVKIHLKITNKIING